MMHYYIYRLQFDTPVHFGSAEQGGKLEQIGDTLPSDTLFSALCCELAQHGAENDLQMLVSKMKLGKLLFSSLFPYRENGDELSLFLPKPVLVLESKAAEKRKTLQETRRQATMRKKQKKMNYIRASHIDEYLASLYEGSDFTENNDFGKTALTEKVNCRELEPRPYYVGSFTYYANSGSYILAAFADKKDASEFCVWLKALGLSGIGGKRSSGYGKFHLVNGEEALDKIIGADAEAITQMVSADSADWQMNLSAIIPKSEEVHILNKSQYKLTKRSGFVTPLSGEEELKKNSIFTLSAGSCFPKRLSGCIVSLGKSNGHDILRAGKGLYVGLSL